MQLRKPVPIIIGGCYRSGTSLVRRILNAHSHIYCGPEVKFWRDFYADYFYDPLAHERLMTSARTILSEEELLQIFGQAFIALHERAAVQAGKVRWADKSPENIVYLSAWQSLLGEDWVLLHIVRNPLDTLASIKDAKFDDTLPLGLEARIAFYNRYLQAGLEFESHCPQRYRRILYEDLVTQPAVHLPAIMEWLGEPFEPIQLNFNQRPHQSGLEDHKIRHTSEIHTESIGRWKELLTRAEAEQIREACGKLWSHVDPAHTWMPTAAQAAEASGPEVLPASSAAPTSAELSQLSEALAHEKFEMERQRVAVERWNKELLEQIELRDRELARIKNLWPIRLALGVKHALKI